MAELSTKTIDGIELTLGPMLGMQALRVQHRLFKCVVPSLSKAFGALEGANLANLSLADLQVDKLSAALVQFFKDCTEDDLVSLAKSLLEGGLANHVPLSKTMDLVFQGKILTLYKAMAWAVVEVNFPDFFGQMPGLLAQAQASLKTTASTSKAA